MILRDISQVREIRCIGKANILEFQNAFSFPIQPLYIHIHLCSSNLLITPCEIFCLKWWFGEISCGAATYPIERHEINFIPGPEKHRWNLIRRVRNQSSRNGCRFDPESCYLQSSFTPFSWSYTRTSKGIRFARCNKESMDKSDNNHWEIRLAAVNEPTTIHSNLSRFRFLPWTTSSFVCIAGYADWLASTQVGALPPTKSGNTMHVVAPIAWLHGLVSCAPPCRRMLHTRCINMYLN